MAVSVRMTVFSSRIKPTEFSTSPAEINGCQSMPPLSVVVSVRQ
jgi:hypothetical protein